MKKLLLGTALVLVFGTRCFAGEDPVPDGFYGSGPHTDGTNWTSHLTKSEYPPDGYTYHDGKRCHWVVVVEKTRSDGSDAGDNFYDTGKPCDELPPSVAGVPMPPVEYVNGGDPGPATGDPNFVYCPPREGWIKNYVISFTPLEEAFYYADGTVIVCRDLKLLVALPPAIKLPSTEAERLKQALEGNPDASDDLLKGKPASDGGIPALSDRKKSEAKPNGTSERSNAKSARTIERASATSEGRSKYARRTVAYKKSEVSHRVAHLTETGHISGMHEAGRNMGSIGAIHGGGFGGLGRMGGMHLGSFGRM